MIFFQTLFFRGKLFGFAGVYWVVLQKHRKKTSHPNIYEPKLKDRCVPSEFWILDRFFFYEVYAWLGVSSPKAGLMLSSRNTGSKPSWPFVDKTVLSCKYKYLMNANRHDYPKNSYQLFNCCRFCFFWYLPSCCGFILFRHVFPLRW